MPKTFNAKAQRRKGFADSGWLSRTLTVGRVRVTDHLRSRDTASKEFLKG
jgi:MOSC domain-containing protein YiiM